MDRRLHSFFEDFPVGEVKYDSDTVLTTSRVLQKALPAQMPWQWP